jgi:hypothetical protein
MSVRTWIEATALASCAPSGAVTTVSGEPAKGLAHERSNTMTLLDTYEVAQRISIDIGYPSEKVLVLLQEVIDAARGITVEEGDELGELKGSLVGTLVPIWDDELWQLFVDLRLYETLEADEMPQGETMTDFARGLVTCTIDEMLQVALDIIEELSPE